MRSPKLWSLFALSLTGVLALLGLSSSAHTAPLPGYRLEAVWPASAHGLPAPSNLSVGPDGRLWLLDGPAGAIAALNTDGSFAERRPVPKDSLDLAIEPGGEAYLGEWSPAPLRSTVGRYAADGKPAWTRQCDCATGTGVAATAGRVWYTDPKNGSLIWFGRADGRVTGKVSPRGVGRGFPADVALAPDGTLFAPDLVAGTVYAWPEPYLPNDYSTWSMLEASGPFRIGVGAQEDGELLIAILFSDGLIRVHRPDGTLLARFFVEGEPLDLAVGQDGHIYVLDEVSRAVSVFVPGPPPTPTPVPPDPPLTQRSCRLTGTRSFAPPQLMRCGATEVKLTIQADCPSGAVSGADVALVIDESQSMRTGGRLDGARAAAKRFLDGLDFRYHQAAIVTFSNDSAVEQPLTTDRPQLDAALGRLAPAGSATNIYAALRAASDHLAQSGRPDALPVIVLLTDGEPTRPMAPEPGTAALVAAERARARRTYIVTIGLGNTIDSLLLEAIASSRDDFYYAPDVVDLDRIYNAILKVVAAMNLTDLVIEDTPAASFTRYVPGSGLPPPLVVNDTLTWTRPALPLDGLSFTYQLAGQMPGKGAAGRARVRYTDADGTRRTYDFPEPELEVILPTATPGIATPVPAATEDPSAPTPLPPAPPPAVCGGDATWWLGITVVPDTVGAGPYACPGCNNLWDGGDHWRPVNGSLDPSTVVVTDASGTPLWLGDVVPTSSRAPARAMVRLCAPPPYRVVLARTPSGSVSCPNSPSTRVVNLDDFGGDQRADTRFALWSGCGLVPPTAVPPRLPTATPGPLPACP